MTSIPPASLPTRPLPGSEAASQVTATATTADTTGSAVTRVGDAAGIAASLLCAVHCLAAPIILLTLPAIAAAWSHPAVHWILAAFVVPLALVVIVRGYRRHRRRLALVAASLGVALILAGLVLPGSGLAFSEAGLAIASPITPTTVGPELNPAAHSQTCTAPCCPSVVTDTQTGAASLNLHLAGVVTIVGSFLLVLGHALNLHGCYSHGRACRHD